MNVMEEERYQKELFEFDKPKRSFPKLDSIFSKNEFAVMLTLDKIIFACIGIIMLMVVIYALGVERGKAVMQPAEQKNTQVAAQNNKRLTVTPSAVNTYAAVKPKAAMREIPIAITTVPETEPAQTANNPYTIVAAAFSKKEWASKEVERLKKSGFDAYVAASDPYYIVCLGAYPNKESARATLNKARKIYKDAYLKAR